MKFVLDTNVVLELLYWRDPRSAPIATALASGQAHCFTDADCLTELERVLTYSQFALDVTAQTTLHATYREMAEIVVPAELTASNQTAAEQAYPLPRCRDTDDQKFMELALRCTADLLITRDRELLLLARSRRTPPPFAIVTPEQAALKLTVKNT